MEDLTLSITKSLDGNSIEIYPYLDYLLQDIFELGTSSDGVVNSIRKNIVKDNIILNVLDLGCGKGAVSIKISKELGYKTNGIDAMEKFINAARKESEKLKLDSLTNFEVGDIRDIISKKINFDIIILGAIGPVFGDIHQTLLKIKGCLVPQGFVIIDDGYIDDDAEIKLENIDKKTEYFKKIEMSGFTVVDKIIFGSEELYDSDLWIYNKIKNRAQELSQRFPEKKHVFEEYLQMQSEQNDIIENKIECGILLLKKVVSECRA